MQREKVSIEDIDAILASRDLDSATTPNPMLRVNYLRRRQPNWYANFAVEQQCPFPS